MLEFLRKDLLLILAVAAVLVSLSYAIGFVTKRPVTYSESQPAFLEGDHAPKAQSSTSRTWKEPSFEKLLVLGAPKVTKPMFVRVADHGEIYILDWADLRIKKFSPDGNLLSVFGDGKGTGAGGFTNPTSFSIAPNGELWVVDPIQRKLTHFEPDGDAQATALEKGLYRVIVQGKLLVTMAPPSTTGLFEIYSVSGKPVRSFGEFLQNQSQQGIMLDGSIDADGDDSGFVYGGRHLGIIASFSMDGSQRYVARTIDGNPLPKVLHMEEGRLRVKPQGADTVLGVSIRGDYVYLLSGTLANDAGGAGGQVMDVYDKRNGNYVFSMRLPIPCKEAIVGADLVYTLGDEGVTVWRFHQNS